MGRRSAIGCAALVFIVGFAVQPAHGKDRKGAADQHRAAHADMVAAREANAKAARSDLSAASTERAAASSAVLDRDSRGRNGAPTAPLREQQAARPNALSFKLGAVTVRPAVGGIKGAQFSIGF